MAVALHTSLYQQIGPLTRAEAIDVEEGLAKEVRLEHDPEWESW